VMTAALHRREQSIERTYALEDLTPLPQRQKNGPALLKGGAVF
jgi:hypothetical protein